MYTQEELLILTKTYPSPSTKHRETTCVAALNKSGELRRLFPIPYRLLDGRKQFQKWEWIGASITRSKRDQRPESHRIDIDSIQRLGKRVGPDNEWAERRELINPHIVKSFSDLESRRQVSGLTLGFIRPTKLVGLEIVPEKNPDWTGEDKVKLYQDGLFDSEEIRERARLRKLPYMFYYHYTCDSPSISEQKRHKITDWEVGALYWNCYHRYGRGWEKPFRQKLEYEFSRKDLHFLMGTVHRFPDTWLIVGLMYPPIQAIIRSKQLQLNL